MEHNYTTDVHVIAMEIKLSCSSVIVGQSIYIFRRIPLKIFIPWNVFLSLFSISAINKVKLELKCKICNITVYKIVSSF
jgi:hypothetical protein